MDTSKIKNFIIIILIIANVFLLTTELIDSANESESKRIATEELVRIFEARGISLPSNIDVFETSSQAVELTRDLEVELDMVQSLLGTSAVTEQGGNIYVYNAKYGQASFRGTGEFEILLNYGLVDGSRGVISAAETALEEMGFDISEDLEYTYDNEQHKVTAYCMYNGIEVYNASIECIFSGDNLMMISGKRVFDTKKTSESTEIVDMSTALIAFLNKISENGYVCTAILDISQAYEMTVSISGDCTLSQIWRVETDTGSYIMDVVSGKFEII